MSTCILLKLFKQFPAIDGWQSTLLAQIDGFIPATNESIQIHLVSGNHWVTSSSLGHEVVVYDSKLRRGKLNSTLTHQLCLIYRTLIKVEINTGHLIVQFPYTPKQKGGSDCGVFAIAFAFHAAMGDNISGFQFDQLKMRRHLMKCLRKQNFTPFPILDKQSKIPKKVRTEKIDVYCTCLMPDTYGDMVQCENCHKWFHIKCVGRLHFPTAMTNGHALLVCETEIFIQPFSFPFLDCEFISPPPPPPPPASITFTLTPQK